MRFIEAIAICFLATSLPACSRHQAKVLKPWDPRAAASYLDARETSWEGWTGSARDHGTFCVSCHTALPYALARPALRSAMAEEEPSVHERALIENVRKRVRLGRESNPYYSDKGYDHKSAESRGTEAVLNALVLANYDSEHGTLSEDTKLAFDSMWATQVKSGENRGSWPWLQFGEEPWEAQDSAFYGAALAAIAVGVAPENYNASPEIQDHIRQLREYLNRESASQSVVNRVFYLWASTKLPGLVDSKERDAIVKDALSRQEADGGWRLSPLIWSRDHWSLRSWAKARLREDGTFADNRSDGFATALITLALQAAHVPADNVQLQRGLTWLKNNQDSVNGTWYSSSVNKRRNPTSNTGRFMTDAATAYAVLALSENQLTASTSFPVSKR
jgi:squalene-hopene/tetraprenyl-beta-curcumene cyclase